MEAAVDWPPTAAACLLQLRLSCNSEDYYPPGVVQLSKANKVSLSLASNPGKKSKKNKVRTTTTTAAPEVFEDEEVFDDEVEEEPEQADAEE